MRTESKQAQLPFIGRSSFVPLWLRPVFPGSSTSFLTGSAYFSHSFQYYDYFSRPSCGLPSAVGCEGAPHFNAFIRSDFVRSEGDTLWPAGIYPAKTIDHRAQLALQTRSNLVRSRPGRSAFLPRLESYLAVQQRAKLSLHVQPLRAAVGRPGFRLRFCASGCLPCFASLALPGLFPGLLACIRYICPAACLCALSESLCGLPSLPFSIRAAACRSASALPSMAARLCLPKEERPPGFVPGLRRCFAACFSPAGASRHTD